jgi:hypothetical protein
MFSIVEENQVAKKLDQLEQGSMFKTIEYQVSDIVNMIRNIDNYKDQEIKDIISRQHAMILNYDLFLENADTRAQAQYLFTNKRFLSIFVQVIGKFNLTPHEVVCINKLCYDYYILPNKDNEVSELLYQISTIINNNKVIRLSATLGMNGAKALAMISNSSLRMEKNIHRINTYLVRYHNSGRGILSTQDMINIFCILYENFKDPFVFTMLESKPNNLTEEEETQFDNISMAILELLNSMTSNDMKKILYDYGYTLNMISSKAVRFSLKSCSNYPRIIRMVNTIETEDNVLGNIIIP